MSAAARLLADDLRRTLSGDWSCTVSPDYVLTVVWHPRQERVALDPEVFEDGWPTEAWSEQFREHTLDDDATEAVMDEVVEVLRLWGETWPLCPQHRRQQLDNCSGVWLCNGPPEHDVAALGHLVAGQS